MDRKIADRKMGSGEWGTGSGEKILSTLTTPDSPLPTPHFSVDGAIY